LHRQLQYMPLALSGHCTGISSTCHWRFPAIPSELPALLFDIYPTFHRYISKIPSTFSNHLFIPPFHANSTFHPFHRHSLSHSSTAFTYSIDVSHSFHRGL
jgi:hypothetical protein